AIVADLEQSGNLVKIEDYAHNVGECYRCHTTVEPIISRQWFVSMKELAKPAIEVVKNGQVKFVPERFSKIYFNWMENIRDWCISRQLWWGHRIPAYYCQECGEMVVAMEQPKACPKCGCQHFHQDEDVLDTWFSSGLWPFSTLGWPEKTAELEYFYPTNVLVTGYDIIFFWVARMIVFGMEVMGKPPFEYVNIHGIVRDSQGRKMSKSLNNGIDPLKVIEQHGADALRFSLANGTSPGSDMRFYDKKVEAAGNFANKIWNASRFVAMNMEGQEIEKDLSALELDIADRWILSRLNGVIRDVTDNMEKFELGLATAKIYDFIWSEYCDWYIEMCKSRLYGEDAAAKKTAISVLYYVLVQALKLLHPFMPFITEEIYVELLEAGGSIMISDWPKYQEQYEFAEQEQSMLAIMEVVRSVRNTRAEMNVPPAKKAKILISTAQAEIVRQTENYLLKLANASEVQILPAGASEPENCAAAIVSLGQVYLPLGDLIDVEKELARLQKEQKSLEGEIARCNGKLQNQGFLAKAPEKVVQEEKDKLAKYAEMLERVSARLESLKAL
ncbi:MAG: valine--tRNA ligase, partial [Clostridiales bacterium]|nr:valine--tRNA ligase [Clostridiales bacterium]